MAGSGFEVGIKKAVAPAIADKVPIDILAQSGFLPLDFAIADARNGVAPQATIDTH